jgi:hypothetical protein
MGRHAVLLDFRQFSGKTHAIIINMHMQRSREFPALVDETRDGQSKVMGADCRHKCVREACHVVAFLVTCVVSQRETCQR